MIVLLILYVLRTNRFSHFNFINFSLASSFCRQLHGHGGIAIWAKKDLDVTPINWIGINLEDFCR